MIREHRTSLTELNSYISRLDDLATDLVHQFTLKEGVGAVVGLYGRRLREQFDANPAATRQPLTPWSLAEEIWTDWPELRADSQAMHWANDEKIDRRVEQIRGVIAHLRTLLQRYGADGGVLTADVDYLLDAHRYRHSSVEPWDAEEAGKAAHWLWLSIAFTFLPLPNSTIEEREPDGYTALEKIVSQHLADAPGQMNASDRKGAALYFDRWKTGWEYVRSASTRRQQLAGRIEALLGSSDAESQFDHNLTAPELYLSLLCGDSGLPTELPWFFGQLLDPFDAVDFVQSF
jgi:hypothetical protein